MFREALPEALKEDKEALDIIVPTLATTLATLYEARAPRGGTLRRLRWLNGVFGAFGRSEG